MKSRIILFLIVVFTINGISVVYGDEITTSKPAEAKIYLEYALLDEDVYPEEVNLFGYISDFFNISIDGDIGFGADENSNSDLTTYAMNQTKPYSLTIKARKTILEW